MPTSIVKIYNKRYSKWFEGAKVALGWNGIVNLGVSRNIYTDQNGLALIEHASTGEAEVYINGSMVGYMQTPGTATFEV